LTTFKICGSSSTRKRRSHFPIRVTRGSSFCAHFTPAASIGRGVALCPEDRKVEGILGDLSVRENIVLALQAGHGWLRRISTKEQYALAERYITLLRISTPTADQKVSHLSGGNQQKVILARWLAANPRVLILDEPTRGIDVGTKADLQQLVLTLADEGKACVFISSELDEVLRTCHRVVVMRDRAKAGEFSGQLDEHDIMREIAGTMS
jgi:simple sugar transport system ATP-binding protein